MPWNRGLRRRDAAFRERREFAVFVEAVGATVGRVARRAGFVFNDGSAQTGYQFGAATVYLGPDDGSGEAGDRSHSRSRPSREHTVLYEAHPDEFATRFPHADEAVDPLCVDLWIHWRPEEGLVEVSVPGHPGLGDQDANDLPGAPSLLARDPEELRGALQRHAEVLDAWLFGASTTLDEQPEDPR